MVRSVALARHPLLLCFLNFIRLLLPPAMHRLFISGMALLLCGAIAARNKPEPAIFVFLRVDVEHGVAVLRPMIAPDIGVQVDSGPRTLNPGTVLRCQSAERAHEAIVEGQAGKISELTLDCGEHKFVVKTLYFSPSER